jgi:S-adenosylmethionine synthetase
MDFVDSRIVVEPLNVMPVFSRRFEIVERKGIGHPDTMCDLLMDEISAELSRLYLKESGRVLHHNLDKAMLAAGQSENRFGGGKITRPMKLILGDRATYKDGEHTFHIEEVGAKTAISWFERNLRFVKKEHIEFEFVIGSASPELQSTLKPRNGAAMANDTSALVGYAPLTKTETAVLETERYINSGKFKSEFPESGEDVKVMGFRDGNTLEITVAMAFVDACVNSEASYFQRKKEMHQAIREFHDKKGYFEDTKIVINNLDKSGIGADGLYLTVLGTSADSSDSGQVGRGNRVNQVISLMRPSGSEAAAGKNAVSHIGKIYNVMCFSMADEIYRKVNGIEEVSVWMYNTIGSKVNEPRAVIVQPVGINENDRERITKEIAMVVQDNLANMGRFCENLVTGKFMVA